MSRHLEGLNPEQARAVRTLDGPLLVLAGAGSGKTRVLTKRIAYLLESRLTVAPWNVLAVTFTNKAAAELRERLEKLIGERAKKLWLGTFHSVCIRILRMEIEAIGFRRDFAVWDDDDQLRILKEICRDRSLGINQSEHSPAEFRERIDRAKNELKSPEDFKLLPHDPFQKVFKHYQSRLKTANALDFNDIIGRVIEVWSSSPDCLERWRARFQYVMVDEYQDTNPAQFRLLQLLIGESGPQNLAVVGDDDQSIYSFRGADIRNILDFEKVYPNTTVIKLERNYRSTGVILKAASGVVRRNKDRKDKTLWTEAVEGEPIRLFLAADESDEASRVVGEIQRQIRAGRKPGELAIIFRTNSQSRSFEQVLSNARISYILVGGRKFYERREVRDLLAYLKLVLNPADDMAFMRIVNVPTRGLGDKSISALQEEAARLGIPLRDAARKAAHQSGRAANAFSAFSVLMDRFEVVARMLSPAALIQYIARETGYLRELELENNVESQSRIENIQELARSSGDSTPVEEDPLAGLREFIDRATLSSQSDELPNESGAVTLLTVHLAKGLEYPIVFIVGLVNGLFPHARSESEREREEERRLFYVALTRAQERLFLSFPARRRFPDGGFAETELSPFLLEIPADVFAQADRAWLPRLTGEVPPRPRTPWPPINSTPGYNAPTRTLSPPRPPLRPQQTLSSTRPASPPSLPPAQSSPSLFPSSPLQPEEGNKNRRTLIPDSMEAFRPGVEVFHPTLGTGSITRRDGIPSNPRLTIHFHKHGPRTVFAAWAGLEVVL